MTDIKGKFYQRYPGPRGRHLSCLTATTLTGSFKEDEQMSIHPRVINGRTRHAKVNTCAPRSDA